MLLFFNGMKTTVKLYYEDMYMREFEAKVIFIEDNKVALDKTAFFPEGGGQVGDTGTLNGELVIDTQIQENIIIHLMESKPTFKPGDSVKGALDWKRRYKIMKLHSASHMMEYFLWEHLGKLERLGSKVDEKKDRADYVYEGRIPPEALKLVEEDTNKFLEKGHEVIIQKDTPSPGRRNWISGPVEMQCGGIHVLNTREIGRIKLKRKNPGRGTERVETSLIT
jgi:Ser-tRNA(Ala) deacylase AlaX